MVGDVVASTSVDALSVFEETTVKSPEDYQQEAPALVLVVMEYADKLGQRGEQKQKPAAFVILAGLAACVIKVCTFIFCFNNT